MKYEHDLPDRTLGPPGHLVRRFFEVLTSRGLSAEERQVTASWLTPETAEIFFAQDDADQRHGYESALIVLEDGGSGDVALAALLHDVGKRHASLGVIGRSLASVLILIRFPLPERMRAYRDHGAVAAEELAALSVPEVVVDFARHHHGERPSSIDPDVWELLVAADRARRRRA